MLSAYMGLNMFIYLYTVRDRFWISETYVYRRQILTPKVDPRVVMVNIFI